MKSLLQISGLLLILLGVVVLVLYAVLHWGNAALVAAIAMEVVGLAFHIVVNRMDRRK